MLCKKCKTSISDKEKNCGYCGAKLSSHTGIKAFASAIVLVGVVLVSGYYIYLNENGLVADFTDLSEKIEDSGNGINDDGDSKNNINFLVNPTEKPMSTENPALSASLNLFLDINDVWDMLNSVSRACSGMVVAEKDTTFISKKGYLFNFNYDRFVDVYDLNLNNEEKEVYSKNNILLLYLRPIDFQNFKEVSFSNSETLEIFVGYETKDGIALVSPRNRGVLHRENFNELIKGQYYYDDNIKIEKPLSNSQDFKKIKALIKNDLSNEIDVRYVSTDGNKAIAVISERNDSSKIKGYLLEKINDEWGIVLSNIQSAVNEISFINNKFPNTNLLLLPSYNLSEANKELLSSDKLAFASNAINRLTFSDEELLEAEDVSFRYLSANSKIAYAVTSDRNRYIIYYSGSIEGWIAVEVEDWEAAMEMVILREGLKSTYVVTQE